MALAAQEAGREAGLGEKLVSAPELQPDDVVIRHIRMLELVPDAHGDREGLARPCPLDAVDEGRVQVLRRRRGVTGGRWIAARTLLDANRHA
jgi:hypothetical protein